VKGIITCQASLTSPIRPSRNIRRASVSRARMSVLNAIVIYRGFTIVVGIGDDSYREGDSYKTSLYNSYVIS